MRRATALPGLHLHLPLVMLTLTLMLAGPFVAGGAFAGTDTSPTEVPEPDATEIPSPEPTAVPTETPLEPTAEPPSPTEVPPPETSDILNDIRTCPPGYEPLNLSWATLLGDCPDIGVGFTISVTVPDGPWLADTSGDAGMVTFTDIPAGEVTLSQQPRDGFGDPYVFCSIEGSDAPQPVAAPGSEFRYGVRANLEPTSTGVSGEACFWFNIPLDAGTGGTIFKYTCPEDFDATGATLDDYLAACETPGAGITLAITGANYAVEEMTDPAGVVSLADLPLGTISITEQDATEYKLVVFCEDAPGAFAPVATTGTTSVDVIVPDTFEVTCYLFNIPVEPDLTIEKYYCPPDADVRSMSIDELLEICDEPGPNVSFDGIGDDFAIEDQVVQPGGRIAFTDVPAGDLTVIEAVPDGYGEPIVYCQVDGTYSLVANAGGASAIAIQPDLPPLYCVWFNIPEDDDLTVRKYYCPPGYEGEEATFDDFLADCSDAGEEVAFTVTGNGYAADATTDERGIANFPNVPVGIVSLTEHAPTDFEDELFIYCWSEDVASFVGGRFTQGEPGELEIVGPNLECYVFNIPPPLSEVVVIKYLCRPGVEIVTDPRDFGPTVEDYIDACPDTAEGVGFAMSNADYQERSQTDADGMVTFSDVPFGRFQLEEDLPRGYGDPVVFCGWSTDDGAVLPTLMPTYRTFLDAAIPEPGVRFVCHWFNIALEPDATEAPYAEDSGRLLIEKHVCPPGIVLGNPLTLADLTTLSVSCPDFHEGVDFTFTNVLGFDQLETTNEFGGIAIIDAAAITMSIDEEIPDGFAEPVVFCHVDDGSGGSMYAPMAPVDGAFDYTVRRGINNVCLWFNMPAEVQTATVRLVSHLCPPGVDPSRLRFDDSRTQCPDVVPDTGFLVAGENSKQYALTGDGGEVTFEEVPFGRITVLQDPLPGFGRSVVFCGWSGEDKGSPVIVDPTVVPLTRSMLNHAIPSPNAIVTCFWFNLPVAESAAFFARAIPPPGTNQLSVTTWSCPAHLDAATEPATLTDECDTLPGVLHYLQIGGPVPNPQQVSDATGLATWPNLPTGSWTVYQRTPQGHDTEFAAWCRYLTWPGDATGIDGSIFQPATGAVTTDVATMEGEFAYDSLHLTCDLYNFLQDVATETPDPTGEIDMHVTLCPEGYTFETFDRPSMADCLPGETGITFTATDGRGYTETSSPSDGSWRVFFDNVPLDRPITITRDVSSGLGAPFATCDQGNGVLGVVPADNGITMTLETPSAGAAFEQCIWFTVLSDADTTVTIDKHDCGEVGSDLDISSLESMLATCPDPGDGVTFHVYDANVEGPVLLDQTDENGHLEWSGPAGQRFSVLEEVEDGYDDPLIFCTYGSAAAPDTTWELQPFDTGNQLTSAFPLAPGYTWACHWFNLIYPPDLGEIGFSAYRCPDGYLVNSFDRDQMLADCQAAEPNLTFTVTDGAGFTGQDTTDTSGEALILGIPTNVPLTITVDGATDPAILACSAGELGYVPIEDTGSGYPYTVYSTEGCYWFSLPSTGETPTEIPATEAPTESPTETPPTEEPTEVPATEGPIEVPATEAPTEAPATESPTEAPTTETPTEIPTGDEPTEEPGQDAPADETDVATIQLVKYTCAEGIATDQDEGHYLDTCSTGPEGVRFTLNTVDGDQRGTTSASGELSWDDVPVGAVSIQEEVDPAWIDPVVFCGDETGRSRLDASGGYVEFEITEPGDWSCVFINIPGGPGEIVIEHHTCPAGFDIHAFGSDPVEDCLEASNGIVFSLEGPGGTTGSTTGEAGDGMVRFGGLATGAYVITETPPEGTVSSFILDCSGQRQGQLRPYPLAIGTTLALSVNAGERITCHWYNVPAADQATGRLEVIVHTCTTDAFVTDIDCQVDETGVAIDLAWWNGDAWEITTTRTTDQVGRASWDGLDPGAFWLDQREGDFCHLASDQLSDNGNWLNVNAGERTEVHVYTCGAEPGKPPKTPLKYPNTGVAPVVIPDRTGP